MNQYIEVSIAHQAEYTNRLRLNQELSRLPEEEESGVRAEPGFERFRQMRLEDGVEIQWLRLKPSL